MFQKTKEHIDLSTHFHPKAVKCSIKIAALCKQKKSFCSNTGDFHRWCHPLYAASETCGGIKAERFNPFRNQIECIIIIIIVLLLFSLFFPFPLSGTWFVFFFFFTFASVQDWCTVWFVHADCDVTAMKYSREKKKKNRLRYINLIGGRKKKKEMSWSKRPV